MTAPTSAAMTLADLANGATARVLAVVGDPMLRERLVELGFTPGSPVTVLGHAPLGDPLRVRIRGGSLAVRRDEAACIRVETAEAAG